MHHARVSRRESRLGGEGESDGLSSPHSRLVRSLPQASGAEAVDRPRRQRGGPREGIEEDQQERQLSAMTARRLIPIALLILAAAALAQRFGGGFGGGIRHSEMEPPTFPKE